MEIVELVNNQWIKNSNSGKFSFAENLKGKATAIELASRGAKVHLACRSLVRGEKACQEIIKKSGNSDVSVRMLDLSSFKSIRDFAKKFTEEIGTLHVLVNNAGIMVMSLNTLNQH